MVAQGLRRHAKGAQVAANAGKGGAHSQVAPGIRLGWRQHTGRLGASKYRCNAGLRVLAAHFQLEFPEAGDALLGNARTQELRAGEATKIQGRSTANIDSATQQNEQCNELDSMKIRAASPQDAKAISALIQSVAHYFAVNPDGSGAEDFLKTISPESIERHINDSGFVYLVGFTDDHLIGVVSIRDNQHLYHLFVSPKFHRLGHARELWETAKDKAVQLENSGEFTVNSTLFAMPAYAKLGFEAIGPKVETKGIALIPMKFRQRA